MRDQSIDVGLEIEGKPERVATALHGSEWLVVNMNKDRSTTILDARDLARLGSAMTIYPEIGFLVAAAG